MMRYTRSFFLTLFCILAATAAAAGGALAAQRAVPAPVNPEFVRYLRDLRDGTSGGRLTPKAYLTPETRAPRARVTAQAETPLPPSYDLADYGWVTGVKNQRSWGTCWDFAAMEAIESNLKKTTGVEYELSELHLGFFAYYPESDVLPAFDRTVIEGDGQNPIFNNGGTASKVRAILSRGTGPVFDSDAPYPRADASDKEFWTNYPEDPEALRGELLLAKSAFRLKESLAFSESDDIKRALMEYGGLWVAFNATANLISLDHPYFYTTVSNVNHAVLLTGWDDAMPGGLFNDYNTTGASADIDGAWKIQNSWGISRDINGEEIAIGDGGYFWISYADKSVFNAGGANSFIAMPADSYQHTYSHDPLGLCYVVNVSGEVVTANVFTSERDEEIVYVGFCTEGTDVGYSIQIYRDVPAGADADAEKMPDAGTPVFDAPQTGTAEFPGYRTVKLTTPVPLNKGERFTVAVTLTADDGGDIHIPVEAKIDRLSAAAEAKPDESFFYDGEEWIEIRELSFDLTEEEDEDYGPFIIYCTNLTIKAFTNSANHGGDSSGGGCSAGALTPMLAALILPAFARRCIKCYAGNRAAD